MPPNAPKTIPGGPLLDPLAPEGASDTLPDGFVEDEQGTAWHARIDWRRWLKVGLLSLAMLTLIFGGIATYLTLRWPAMLKQAITDKGNDQGLNLKYEQVDAQGILPWHSGAKKVTLKGVTIKSEEAPDVELELNEVRVPLKGSLLSLQPERVEVDGAYISAPDMPSLLALEAAAKSGKAGKTPVVITDAKIRIGHIAESLPLPIVGRAGRIEIRDGKVDLADVTLEVPIPFVDFKLGPASAKVERGEDMTWATIDPYHFARIGLSNDGERGKVSVEPVHSRVLNEQFGLDLPDMKLSGDLDLVLAGERAPTGAFAVVLDGYLPPHPKELNGILHGKTSKASGKLRHKDQVIYIDDLVIEAGALKLKGKGRVDFVDGGNLNLDLAGNVACSELAASAVGSHWGPVAGLITGQLASGRLTGTVQVRVSVDVKLNEIKKAKFTPSASIGCGVSL